MKEETPQRAPLLRAPAPFQLDGEAEEWPPSVAFQRCFHVGASCWCCGPTTTSGVLSRREKAPWGPGEPLGHREQERHGPPRLSHGSRAAGQDICRHGERQEESRFLFTGCT